MKSWKFIGKGESWTVEKLDCRKERNWERKKERTQKERKTERKTERKNERQTKWKKYKTEIHKGRIVGQLKRLNAENLKSWKHRQVET